MYLETGINPITDEEGLLSKDILETCYNCFERDIFGAKLIKISNLKPFLFHLFRTENKASEKEIFHNHFVFEQDKLSKTFNMFFLDEEKKARFREQFTFCDKYEKENLVTFCLEDDGDFANSKYIYDLIEKDNDFDDTARKRCLVEFTNSLAFFLEDIRNFNHKDFVACIWHINQLAEDEIPFKFHCHLIYNANIKDTDNLPYMERKKKQEEKDKIRFNNFLKEKEQDKSRARKIRIIIFLIFIILYIIFPNAFWHVLSFIQDVFEFLHEKIFNLIHKWF